MASPHDALSLEDRPGALLARPLRDWFRLPALDASVASARRRVLHCLREWHVDRESRADAELLVSELFTNAVRHTASEKVSCELWVIGVRLRLEVTDQGGGDRPVQRCTLRHSPTDTDGESGRGLLLVSSLADEWGIRPESGGHGTCDGEKGHAVWAELPCTRTSH